MDSDWTVACAADDPVVVVPWANQDGSLRFVDLRSNLHVIDAVDEARKFPALAAALRRWNSANGPMFTVKCDVWNYPARLFDAFDQGGFAHAHASYVDLVSTDWNLFRAFPSCEKLLQRGSATAHTIDTPSARCEWVLRPAQIFSQDPKDVLHGFAVSLYVWGYGETSELAEAVWSSALLALIEPVALTLESPSDATMEAAFHPGE